MPGFLYFPGSLVFVQCCTKQVPDHFFSDHTGEHDLVTAGGCPDKSRDILGIWAEEEDALPDKACNSFTYKKITYPAPAASK